MSIDSINTYVSKCKYIKQQLMCTYISIVRHRHDISHAISICPTSQRYPSIQQNNYKQHTPTHRPSHTLVKMWPSVTSRCAGGGTRGWVLFFWHQLECLEMAPSDTFWLLIARKWEHHHVLWYICIEERVDLPATRVNLPWQTNLHMVSMFGTITPRH